MKEIKEGYKNYLNNSFKSPLSNGHLTNYAAIVAQMLDGIPKKKNELLSQANIKPETDPKKLRNQLSVLFSKLVTQKVLDYDDGDRLWVQGTEYKNFMFKMLKQIPDLFTEELTMEMLEEILNSPMRINRLKKYFKINDSGKPQVIKFLDKLTDCDFLRATVKEGGTTTKDFILKDLSQLLEVIENKTATITKENNSIKIVIAA